MLITILTPTYNRATLLLRLYNSLKDQRCKNFEWIVIDDGSTDNTLEVMRGIIDEPLFKIIYIKQENGGKHRAVNKGVSIANGELVFIADSDDILPEDAITTVADMWRKIDNKDTFGGMAGLDMSISSRKIIGSGLPKDYIDCNAIDIRYKCHVEGDLKEVFRTSVLKEFPFPEIDNERFCPEALVWNRIALKYKLRYINKVIYLVEYQPEGLTSNIVKVRMKSPISSMMCYSEMTQLNIPFKDRMKAAINYWRFRFCISRKDIPSLSGRWFWTAPIGWLMHLKDIRTTKS